MIRLLAVAMILGSMAFLSACNTFSGMGKDTEETANWMTGTPAPSAYHQSARDF